VNISYYDAPANKVEINFNKFGALILDEIGGEVGPH
jgi:hypothetical protein